MFALAALSLASACTGEIPDDMQLVEPSYADANTCSFTDCTTYGMCATDTQGVPVCLCSVGYAGGDCTGCEPNFHLDHENRCVPDRSCAEQTVNPCGTHGSCDDSEGVVRCVCDPGYEGPRCNLCQDAFDRNESDDCLPLVLGPNDKPPETMKPEEEEMQQPPPTSLPPPQPPPPACTADACNGHGTCEEGGGAALCICAEGYSGARCASCAAGYRRDDTDSCVPVEHCDVALCGAHGTCDDGTGLAICACSAGYDGMTCGSCASGYHSDGVSICVLDHQCLPTTCSGHGACTASSGVTTCACDVGYAVPSCDRCATGYHRNGAEQCVVNDVCMTDSCSGHGTCDVTTGVIECTCEAGYIGEKCEGCAAGWRMDATGTCKEIMCVVRPQSPVTFEGMVGFPLSENTCQTNIPFNTTRLAMMSRGGEGNIWACGPSTLYDIVTEHILLEAGSKSAQLIFGEPINFLRFDYAGFSALMLEPRGEGLVAGPVISAARHGNGTVSFRFPEPISVFELRSTNGAINQIALDNILFDYATCE